MRFHQAHPGKGHVRRGGKSGGAKRFLTAFGVKPLALRGRSEPNPSINLTRSEGTEFIAVLVVPIADLPLCRGTQFQIGVQIGRLPPGKRTGGRSLAQLEADEKFVSRPLVTCAPSIGSLTAVHRSSATASVPDSEKGVLVCKRKITSGFGVQAEDAGAIRRAKAGPRKGVEGGVFPLN